ncbi:MULTISPECIES: alanine dehydrogenase [unclassified Motilimonas]|uniref:alanine dehydrogenase n=1 Tax=unclassified Motilimonas TaxID=2643697 RepID=UPI001E566FCC|nr:MULTISPECIES: alanine dehydrogenase [unclassified Motilimonas]MCE0556421.1 alanine dehydrogenase [Motilimonas sp. E26]MDO6525809.1 alanine dehydrogenase [Motilimonas sp. 1_MG-2023]
MIIGVPKEIKNHEYRVGLVPSSVRELTRLGHIVNIETNAGAGIDLTDAEFKAAGANIVASASELFSKSEMIVKVKEPQASERALLKPEHVLFTYLHLAPDLLQTEDLIKSRATCIAYETVTDKNGTLPLLSPMSEVAGRMAIQAGAMALEKSWGGRGLLLAGVPGVAPAKVLVIGGGKVGQNAIKIAIGMGADVTVLDKNINTLEQLDRQYANTLTTLYSNAENLEQEVIRADLVIAAVLLPGAAAPKLITKALLKKMKPGAVIVDVAIDQGGCCETSHPTTHDDPIYIVDNIVHYCVANMPGAVARTATFALNHATLPYVIKLAELGAVEAMRQDPGLLAGLNVFNGQITNEQVAISQQKPWISTTQVLNL